jgi:teichuronic acid biosynthesis glycosyltransferase TuaC
MKILFLTKRQHTHKDLIDDLFGYARELPLGLAELGHEVTGLCLSYENKPEGCVTDFAEDARKKVTWHSLNAGRLKLPGFLCYTKRAMELINEIKPDIVFGTSDSIYAILAVWLAKNNKLKSYVHIADNYASYESTNIPGLAHCFNWALRNADGIACISGAMKRKICEDNPIGLMETIGNGVPDKAFFKRDKNYCRSQVGLPLGVPIVGFGGAITKRYGIKNLFMGFQELQKKEKDIHLAIAGYQERGVNIPQDTHVHNLGFLSYDKMPLFFNALDAAVIMLKENEHCKYCFPQKLHEIMACKTPLVAAAIGPVKEYLKDYPDILFDPENHESFSKTVSGQIRYPKIVYIKPETWTDLSRKLEAQLLKIY